MSPLEVRLEKKPDPPSSTIAIMKKLFLSSKLSVNLLLLLCITHRMSLGGAKGLPASKETTVRDLDSESRFRGEDFVSRREELRVSDVGYLDQLPLCQFTWPHENDSFFSAKRANVRSGFTDPMFLMVERISTN